MRNYRGSVAIALRPAPTRHPQGRGPGVLWGLLLALSLMGCNADTPPTPTTSPAERGDERATAAATETAPGDVPALETLRAPRALIGTDPTKLNAAHSVEVYFATDRLPTAELMPGTLRLFAPAGVVGMLCAALFIGFSAARRFQTLWLIACGLAVCLGTVVWHASLVRFQQYSRLASSASTHFSTLRDESTRDYPLHVGTATISLPTDHAPGQLEAPSLLRLEFIENPDKHIVLRQLQVDRSVDNWFKRLKGDVATASDCEGFIFIHGYNVRFSDAVKRTAQLATDLHISGPAVCYSWPSRGQLASYTADEASVSWTSPHFEQLLLDLRERAGCQRINIVAHSMGNRALLEAIERLHARGSSMASEKLINSLVLAAPDVDVDQFHARYLEPVRSLARHTTVYFSESDRALQLSAGLHRAPRLGFAHSKLPSAAGIEAVHIGQQPLFALGHSYYGSDVAVIDDMRDLLARGESAAKRPLLTAVPGNSERTAYWRIDRALHAQRSGQKTLR